ncbi:MAG: hypothetical protein M0R17_15030 [Candidatus Omnitrophica bacterium]|jgi:hypothetical protein|nr:hypothetical protein [Candidatus Omnitrophota bacterium]
MNENLVGKGVKKDMGKWLSIENIMTMTGKTRNTIVLGWIKTGLLKAGKTPGGREWIVNERDWEKFEKSLFTGAHT